jgi:tetratricopeptide (TPR) repeat protein
MMLGARCCVVAAAVLSVGMVVSSAAQQAMSCHSMTAEPGAPIAPESLPAPEKMTGIGNSYMDVTANAEAKAWFEQGLNLLHDFWDYESAKAFEQAVRVDPQCAMCYWGLYQAESFRPAGDSTYAHDALVKAVALQGPATKAEKLYIKAAVEEYNDKQAKMNAKPSTKKPKPVAEDAPHVDSKETKTLRKLVKMEPQDVQARIFLAESLMEGFDKNGEPKSGTREGQQILVAILKEHPDDTAANHYWIHAVEPGNHPELALDSAKKLGPLTPASGHMVHMPGHIFYRTGDYETARVSFEDSMHVDEAYMQAQHVPYEDDWNYVHNLMYLIADLMEAGRVTEAVEISSKVTAAHGQGGPTLYQQTTRDGLARLNPELPVMLRAGDWRDASNALRESKPDESLKNLVGLRSSMLDYTEGMAALASGDVKKAESDADDLDTRLKEKPEVAKAAATPGMHPMSKDVMAKPVHSFLDVAAMELRASVLLAEGRGVESDAMFTKAADAEKELGYREPPFYIRPVGETRGDALMQAKRYDEAKKAYEAALVERPNSGYPLFGIAQADVAAKRTTDATADYARLMQAWQQADPDLPQLKAARAWMEGQAASGE